MSVGLTGPAILSDRGAENPSSLPICMIVEDQALIALSLEAYLEETGFGVCEPLPSVADALAWLATNTPHVAILDYSLQDGPCTKLIRLLQERGVPFVIYSGQERDLAQVNLQNVIWLRKPCDRAAIVTALTLLITPAQSRSDQPSPATS